MNRLLIFNPGHEEALAQASASSYTPPKAVLRMQRDLALLMTLLATSQDYIYIPADTTQTARLADHLGNLIPPESYASLPPLLLSPWALEPHALRSVAQALNRLGVRYALPSISDTYLHLSHRSASTRMMYYASDTLPTRARFSDEQIPYWIYPSSDTESTLEEIRSYSERSRTHELIMKRPYTSSGRGVSPLSLPLTDHTLLQIAHTARRSRGISLEPRLSVQDDFAMLYYAEQGELSHLGISAFTTGGMSHTAYSGNRLSPQSELRQKLIRLLGSKEDLDRLISWHISALRSIGIDGYTGYIGVDMMSYRGDDGTIRLHPAVEINARCTMGVLSMLAYEQYGRGRNGLFRLDYAPKDTMQSHLKDLGTGYIPLTPLCKATEYHAYLYFPQNS